MITKKKTLSWTRLVVLAIAAVLCLVTTFIPIGQAQDKISTAISPLLFELTANPGDKLENTLKVINTSGDVLTYSMDVESFVGNELGQATVTEQEDPAYALKDWVKVSPEKFFLAPKATQLVSFKITVPSDAEPGGRYGTILATVSGGNAVGGTGAITKSKVGTLILVAVAGDIKYAATVKNFAADKAVFERSPITFTLRIHNDSSVHVKPKGFVTVANIFGRKVIDIPLEEKNALPHSDRLLKVTDDKKLAIGRYTATLAVNYGDKGDQLTATTSFIVFPWKVGLPIIGGLLILLWFAIARRRRLTEALKIIFGKR